MNCKTVCHHIFHTYVHDDMMVIFILLCLYLFGFNTFESSTCAALALFLVGGRL